MTAQPCYTCTPADATNSVPALTQPREAFAYLVIAAGQTGELRTWVCGFVQHRTMHHAPCTMHQLQATKALVKDALSSSPHPNPPSARCGLGICCSGAKPLSPWKATGSLQGSFAPAKTAFPPSVAVRCTCGVFA